MITLYWKDHPICDASEPLAVWRRINEITSDSGDEEMLWALWCCAEALIGIGEIDCFDVDPISVLLFWLDTPALLRKNPGIRGLPGWIRNHRGYLRLSVGARQ
jgi:hypothetical protein